MTHDNILYDLSKKFALRVIKLYPFLCNEKSEFIISKQIYRSGTSIGANIAESMNAQSKADFVILYEPDNLSSTQFDSLINDLNIIIGTLVTTIKNTKKNGGDE